MGLFFLLQRGEMAVGKNKGLKIGGKKGAKKKIVDPFTRKDWYDIKAPANFKNRDIGKTPVNRTQGTKIASDGLKGRVFEVSLADLQKEEAAERSFRKFRFICDDVQGKNCLCSFYGMSLTSDKLKGVVKKCRSIYPMQEVHTRKVEVLKRPKLDRARLMEAHEESGGKVTDPKTGETISKPKYEPKVQESV